MCRAEAATTGPDPGHPRTRDRAEADGVPTADTPCTTTEQDLLGAYQDGHVATDRLRGLAAERGVELGPNTVFAMGEIAERYRREMEEVRRGVPPTLAGLRGKAWKRLRTRMETERPAGPTE